MKKISIVTVCYNEPNIETTCQSILNQTYQDFEWIVIDGGSENSTLEILNKYKDRMNVFISEKDNGIYHAMNKGIDLATGEYINFLNGGDVYVNNDVLKQALEFGFDKDIIYGYQKFIDNGEVVTKEYVSVIPSLWFINNTLPHQSTFIKQELFDKYGKYDETNKIVSDWEKWVVFIEINKSSYKRINMLIAVNIHNGISSIWDDFHFKERQKIIDKYYGLVCPNEEIYFEKSLKITPKHTLFKLVCKKNEFCLYFRRRFPLLRIVRGN